MRTIATMITSNKLRTSIDKVVFLLAIFVCSASGKVAQNSFEDNPSHSFQFDHKTCLGLRSNKFKIECSTVQPATNFSLQIGSSQYMPYKEIPGKHAAGNAPMHNVQCHTRLIKVYTNSIVYNMSNSEYIIYIMYICVIAV